MYKHLIRPILFRFEPETAHKITFRLLKTAYRLRFNKLIKIFLNPPGLHMETHVFGLTFPNKLGIAAGLDKNAEIYPLMGSMGFGHVEIGTVTPKPQPGNPKPRSFRLPGDEALINRMGFNNNGLDAAVGRLRKRNSGLIVGGNIGKNTSTPNVDALADYVACFKGLYPVVDYLVVNVSCPNVTDLHKLQDQESLERILRTLNRLRADMGAYKPILLKISPDLNNHQIDETIEVIQRNEIDGVIAANTTTCRTGLDAPASTIDLIGKGGLSGKPVRDRSTGIIKYIYDKTGGKLPIIGVGGVFGASDAIEKLRAGASLVQVYTGFIYEGPLLAKRINRAIARLHM